MIAVEEFDLEPHDNQPASNLIAASSSSDANDFAPTAQINNEMDERSIQSSNSKKTKHGQQLLSTYHNSLFASKGGAKKSKHSHNEVQSAPVAVPPAPAVPSAKHFNHLLFLNQQGDDTTVASVPKTKNNASSSQSNVPKAFRRPNMSQYPGLKGYTFVEAAGSAPSSSSIAAAPVSNTSATATTSSPWIGMGNTTYLVPVKVLTLGELTSAQAVYLVFDYFGNISVSPSHLDSYYPRFSGQDLLRVTTAEGLQALTTGILPMDKIREMFQEMQGWINDNQGILPNPAKDFLRGKEKEREREMKRQASKKAAAGLAQTPAVVPVAVPAPKPPVSVDPHSSKLMSGVIAQAQLVDSQQMRPLPHRGGSVPIHPKTEAPVVQPIKARCMPPPQAPASAPLPQSNKQSIQCDEEDLFGLLCKRKINELCSTYCPGQVTAPADAGAHGLQQSDLELQYIIDNMLSDNDRMRLQSMIRFYQTSSFWALCLQVVRERPLYAKVVLLMTKVIATASPMASASVLGKAVRSSFVGRQVEPDLPLQLMQLMLRLIPYYASPLPHHRVVMISMLQAMKLLISDYCAPDVIVGSTISVSMLDAVDCKHLLHLMAGFLYQPVPDQEMLLTNLLPFLTVLILKFPQLHDRLLAVPYVANREGPQPDLIGLLFNILAFFYKQCKTTVKMVAAMLKAIASTEEKQVFCLLGHDITTAEENPTGRERCRLLVEVLTHHVNDAVVVKGLCSAIWNLSIASTSVKLCLISSGVCEALVNALCHHYQCLGSPISRSTKVDMDNVPLQQILGAIWTISILPQAQCVFGQHSTLTHGDIGMSMNLSHMLVELLQDNLLRVPSVSEGGASSSVITKEWIVDTLDQCCGIIANVADIPENHSNFISFSLNPVANAAPANSAIANTVTCEELLVHVLRKYGLESAKLCESACSAIWCLLERDPVPQEGAPAPLMSMLSTSSDLGCDVLVTVLSQHMSNEEVVRQSCGAIAMKAMKNLGSRMTFGSAFPGNDLLIHALEGHLPPRTAGISSIPSGSSPFVTLQILKAIRQMILLPSNAKAMLQGKVIMSLMECLSSERDRLINGQFGSYDASVREEIFVEVFEIISCLLTACSTISSGQLMKYFSAPKNTVPVNANGVVSNSSMIVLNALIAQLLAFFDVSIANAPVDRVLVRCSALIKQIVSLPAFLRVSTSTSELASHQSLTIILMTVASTLMNSSVGGTMSEMLVNMFGAISSMLSSFSSVSSSGSSATSSTKTALISDEGSQKSVKAIADDNNDDEIFAAVTMFCDQLLHLLVQTQSSINPDGTPAIGTTTLAVHVVGLLKQCIDLDNKTNSSSPVAINKIKEHLAKQRDVLHVLARLVWTHCHTSNASRDSETKTIVASTLSLLYQVTGTSIFYSQRDIQQSQTMLHLLETVLLSGANSNNTINNHGLIISPIGSSNIGGFCSNLKVISSLCGIIRNIMEYDPFLLDCASRRQWFVSMLVQVRDAFLMKTNGSNSPKSDENGQMAEKTLTPAEAKIQQVINEISRAIQALDSAVPMSTMINFIMDDDEDDVDLSTMAGSSHVDDSSYAYPHASNNGRSDDGAGTLFYFPQTYHTNM